MSFIVPIFGQNVPLISPVFLKRALVVPYCCFLLVLYTVHFRMPSRLSRPFFGYLHLAGYTFPSLPCFLLLFFLQLFIRPPQITHFNFLLFFSFGVVLFAASCTISLTSVYSSSGTLSTSSSPLDLCVTSTSYSWGIGFKSYLSGLVVFTTFLSLSLNFAMRSWWSEPQSAPGLYLFYFADYIELLHLWLQRM